MITGDVPLQNIIDYYEEPTRENVIIMILRCKKMYEARIEVKRIIKLLIMQQDALQEVQGLLDRKPATFNDQEITKLRKFHRVTQKLDSNLAMFRDDHKMFKNRFLYAGKDQYIEVPLLLAHLSRILNGFPEESNSAY